MSQVLESRQTRGDAIRRYATWQFGQHFDVADNQDQVEDEGSIPGSRLAEAYLPKRKFRQKVLAKWYTYNQTSVQRPSDPKIVTVVDKWSLFKGAFII